MQEELFINEPMLDAGTSAGLMGFGMMWMVFIFAIIIISIIASWKIFTKAGKPGWASLIPFYNIYVLLQIAHMPGWWLLAFFIPILNLVASIMLAFGDAKYQGEGSQVAVAKTTA